MPCYNPLSGYRSKTVNPTGKRSIVFTPNQGYRDMPVEVPCGQCIGCRLARSRQWAIRCVHEASLYDENCFITLTYNDDNVPKDGSVNVVDFQKFMKRLRKTFPDSNIRYLHCGEYGEQLKRPHYHACIFNFDFPDKKLLKTVNEHKIYTSEVLEKLWPYGYSTIGSLTFESAAYTARYITKKITGDQAQEHYKGRRPEYVTMSRRPGIGSAWVDKHFDDIFNNDFVVLRGKKLSIPKFYDTRHEKLDPLHFADTKAERVSQAKLHKDNNTIPRLRVREFIQKTKAKLLKRSYE